MQKFSTTPVRPFDAHTSASGLSPSGQSVVTMMFWTVPELLPTSAALPGMPEGWNGSACTFFTQPPALTVLNRPEVIAVVR